MPKLKRQQVMSQPAEGQGSERKIKRSNSLSGTTSSTSQEGIKRNRGEIKTGEETQVTGGSTSHPSSEFQALQVIIKSQNKQIQQLLESVKNFSKTVTPEATRVSAKPTGLFGESTMPNSLSAFPLLAGNTALHYSEWVRKGQLHFTNTGLMEIITLDPQTSFNIAIKKDNQRQSV